MVLSKLIVPIYSARSRESGKYILTADGNLMAILHRFWAELKAGSAIICVPYADLCEPDELQALGRLGISTLSIPYGENIAETRGIFWHANRFLFRRLEGFDELWFGIPFPLGYLPQTDKPIFFMANTSKQTGISQPCDAMWLRDLYTAKIADHVYVQDLGQLSNFVAADCALRSKITVGMFRHLEQALFDAIGYDDSVLANWPQDAWLASFKLSDAEHANLLGMLRSQYASQPIVFTDPTRLFVRSSKFELLHRVMHISKQQYLALLKAKVPFVHYGNPEIWHPGREEAAFFGCKLVVV